MNERLHTGEAHIPYAIDARWAEEDWRALFEALPALIVVADRDGYCVYTNARFQRYAGKSAVEFADNGWLETLHDEDRSYAVAIWQRCVDSDEPGEAELRFVRADGESRWHRWRAEPVRDPEGLLVRWLAICTDIDEHRRGAELLWHRESRYAYLLRLEERLRNANSARDAMTAACEELGGALRAAFVGVAELRADGEHTVVESEWRAGDTPSTLGRRCIADYGARRFAPLLAGEIVRVEDVTTDPRTADDPAAIAAYAAGGARASIDMPLLRDGRPHAFLFVADGVPRRWSESEVALASETVERAWHAAECARAEAALRASEERLARESAALNRLQRASMRLWRARTLSEGLEEMLAGAIELLGANYGNVQLLDKARAVLEIAAHKGFRQEFLDVFREVSAAEDSACGRALRSGERLVIEDVEADPLSAPFRASAQAAGYRAVQSTPILSSSGTPLGMLSTHFRAVHRPAEEDLALLDLYVRQTADFIERARADAALRASEERLALALESGQIGLWEWDVGANRAVWNAKEYEVLGYSVGDGVEPTDRFFDLVHPDDRPALDRTLAAVMQEGSDWRDECRITRPNGELRWIAAVGRLFRDVDGRPRKMIGINYDITLRKQAEAALRESEERYRVLHEGMRDAFVRVTMDGRIVEFNTEYQEMLGYSPEDLCQLTYRDLTPEHWHAHEEAIVRDEILPRGYSDVYEKEYRRKDGTVFPVELRTILAHDATGRPSTMWAVVRDITERKRAEQHRELLVNELNHRVKNTLATIQSIAAQTLRTGCERQRQAFAERLHSLAKAHDLLTRENWDAASLNDTALEALRPYLADGRVSLVAADGSHFRLSPKAALALSMALHELATNAAKYGALSNTSGRVNLSWSVADGLLRLSWRESGGPPVRPPTRRGFGSRLIERGLALELNGEVTLTYDPAGVVCEIVTPLERCGREGLAG